MPIAVPLSAFTNQKHIFHFEKSKRATSAHSDLKPQAKELPRLPEDKKKKSGDV